MTQLSPPPANARLQLGFAAAFGCFLGLALLKFGTPSVMDRFVSAPGSPIEWVIFVWQLKVAYPLIGLLAIASLTVAQWKQIAPAWLTLLPVAWLGWQCIAGTQSVDTALTQGVLAHFTICVVCFFLGALCLNHAGTLNFLIWPIAISFAIMLSAGLEQHFGGLEETRRYFWTYLYPTLPNLPPEYLKKMQSNRIFATVFYPNAFAGALLLLLPGLLAWTWQAKQRFTPGARGLLCGLLGLSSAGCLYWTGSKGGWLLALLIGATALLHQAFSPRLKWLLIAVLLVGGGASFYLKNRAYLERGATSVVARFDYWQAAWHTAVTKPVFGSGPGTFAIAYESVRKPESEMARLTHNDYLQQASDSGFPGFIAYALFIISALSICYRRLDWRNRPVVCGIWLGVAAWAVQSAFEFTLYVPSLAWTAFALMGWLLATTQESIRHSRSPAPNLSAR